jgi:hypothetical protein
MKILGNMADTEKTIETGGCVVGRDKRFNQEKPRFK